MNSKTFGPVRRFAATAMVTAAVAGGLMLTASPASAAPASAQYYEVGPFNSEWECKAAMVWMGPGDFCWRKVWDGKWYFNKVG